MNPVDYCRSFAGRDRPIRVSSLYWLTKCQGAMLLKDPEFGQRMPDEGSEAADTGTAAGRMVELYHLGKSIGECIRQTGAEAKGGYGHNNRPFDKADMERAGELFALYAGDPLNPVESVEAWSLEHEVRLELPPADSDPTREPVCLVGHIDQVRRDADGVYRVWDVKAGRGSGVQMIHEYAWQLSAYTLGLARSGRCDGPVEVGGIIRLAGYVARERTAVFFPAPWSLADCENMMDTIREAVGQIRAGRIPLYPSPACQYCPGGGAWNCHKMFP